MTSSTFSHDVAAAIAAFFHGGDGPSHSTVSRALTQAGYSDDYRFAPETQGPNKEQRVLDGFARARRDPDGTRRLVDGLLGALRHASLIGRPPGEQSEDEKRLRAALSHAG